MAIANLKAGIAVLIDGIGGGGDTRRWDYQDAFGCLGVVAISGTEACQLVEKLAHARDVASGGTIIRKPAMEAKVGEFCFKKTDEGKKAEGVKKHGGGIALRNSCLAVNDNQLA
jgi:hypothetical protein